VLGSIINSHGGVSILEVGGEAKDWRLSGKEKEERKPRGAVWQRLYERLVVMGGSHNKRF
jgi:hypothetical protein